MTRPPIWFRLITISAMAVSLASVADGAPTGTNLGFESNLTGWTSANVMINTAKPHAGIRCLALKTGYIQQTFTGLTPGAIHTLSLAYRDNTPESYILSHARILIDGVAIGEIHNGQDHEYLDCGGFEFVAAAASAVLRIESLGPGPEGFLLDSIRISNGGLPAPPEHAWTSLVVKTDARGGRQLVNGGFESATSNPNTDPHNSGPAGNPHLCGFSLPGWLVTRENVDVIGSEAKPPEGGKVLDTSGHGPGGIVQTITGLQPGGVYTLSFRYARHVSWGNADMTGEVRANGRLVSPLVRTNSQNWNSTYATKEIPVLASAAGKLTVEIRSTITNQGGCIIYDDVRLRQGGDGFLAWSVFHDIAPLPGGDDDRDGLTNDFEFLLGTSPMAATPLPVAHQGTLHVPLSGLALSQGYTHQLLTSRGLDTWLPAADPASGMMLLSDTTSPGGDGEKVYAIDPGEPRLFWRHLLSAP